MWILLHRGLLPLLAAVAYLAVTGNVTIAILGFGLGSVIETGGHYLIWRDTSRWPRAKLESMNATCTPVNGEKRTFTVDAQYTYAVSGMVYSGKSVNLFMMGRQFVGDEATSYASQLKSINEVFYWHKDPRISFLIRPRVSFFAREILKFVAITFVGVAIVHLYNNGFFDYQEAAVDGID